MITYTEYELMVNGRNTTITQDDLFDFYVETLREKQIVKDPDQFGHLRAFMPPRGMFILVPGTPIPLDALMARITLNGKLGKHYFDKEFLTDVEETFHWHYLCLDVDDGRALINKRPADAIQLLKSDNRLGYVIKEGIFHLMYFPEILTHHCIDTVGSRYFKKFIPRFYLAKNRPSLSTRIFSYSSLKPPIAGSASCARRVAF